MKDILFRILFTIFAIVTFYLPLVSQEILERGRFSGLMFGDYYYNIMRDKSIGSIPFANYKDPQDLNGFEFRRIYFTYDYQISDKFYTKFRLEIGQIPLTTNSKLVTYVRDANLQWKNIFKGSTLTFGIQPTPTFDISEYVWENRHLEMTIIDLNGIMESRDFGISLKGKIDQSGIFNYWVLFANGSGARQETDKYKTAYVNILFKPSEIINAYLNFHHKFQKPVANKFVPNINLNRDEDLLSLFFSYHQKNSFKLGLEGFVNYVRNNIEDSIMASYKNRTMFGLSIFGIYYLSEKFNLVLRYDYFDPNAKKEYQNDRRNLYIFGLNYKPVENVTVTPTFYIETYEKTQNATYKPSITSRIVFFYVF